MLTLQGVVLMFLGAALAALPDLLPATVKQLPEREISPRAHRRVCVALFAAGCLIRLWRLPSLPSGISAEEALVGVQAKSLWQTGGFLFGGRLTAQLAQWRGESGGPLLATLTAPFVGLMGMTPLATRLPLALLSCAAMPAAYGLGKELSGPRAGRWCLAAYAVCPYFALTARLTYGVNAAVSLAPVAVYLLVLGARKSAALYAGALLTALLAYAQDMYFFLSPAYVALACGVAAARGGVKKRHALGAALLGLAVCVPALLTLWVNLGGREGFTWLGIVDIPRLEEFDKADWLFAHAGELGKVLPNDALVKLWSVVIGGVFQAVMHENISGMLFTPNGMLALYAFSVPLILLGAASLLSRRLRGERVRGPRAAGRAVVTALASVTLLLLTLFGTKGVLILNGTTSAPDLSSFFLFDVLLMAAGMCRIQRRNRLCSRALTALFAASFAFLCAYVLAGSYDYRANVYFDQFQGLAVRAEQERQDEKIVVTSSFYPHRDPQAAATFMYLYATDADMRTAEREMGVRFEARYLSPDETPDAGCIYLARQSDTTSWDYTGFDCTEAGGFVLLVPQRAGE